MKKLVFGILRPLGGKNVVSCVAFGLNSEGIMASASLQPDMEEESKELQLRDGLLEQLKLKYCCRMEVRRSPPSAEASHQPVKSVSTAALVGVTAGGGEILAGPNPSASR